MPRLLQHLFILVTVVAACAACNSDIFIDDGPKDGRSISFDIEGDGGSATFSIPSKDLKRIELLYNGFYSPYKYYDRDGKEIPEGSPGSDVARVSFESERARYELIKNGNRITFNSIENCMPNDIQVTIRMEYSYGTVFATINISRGRPLQLTDVSYNGGISTYDHDAEDITHREIFNNNSQLPQTINTTPLLTAEAYGEIVSDENWTDDEIVDMPVLQYENGWVIKEKENIRSGSKFVLTVADRMATVPITIPAYTKVTITYTRRYQTAEASGTMTFRSPVSGKEQKVGFKCKAVYPIAYNVKVENAK